MDTELIKKFKAETRAYWSGLIIFIYSPFYFCLLFLLSQSYYYTVIMGSLSMGVGLLVVYFFVNDFIRRKIKFDSLEHEMKVRYSVGGPQYLWSDITRAYNFDINYIPAIWANLKDQEFMPQGKDLVIYSISAHKGEYERELLYTIREDSKYEQIDMLLSDAFPPLTRVHDLRENGLTLTYWPQPLNAENLNLFLDDRRINVVQILWDFKGFLWYTKHKKENVYNAFKILYDALDSKGLLIIDAYEQNSMTTAINGLLYRTTKTPYGYPESSTFEIIKNDIDQIRDLFDVQPVGEGKYRVVVFQKKT